MSPGGALIPGAQRHEGLCRGMCECRPLWLSWPSPSVCACTGIWGEGSGEIGVSPLCLPHTFASRVILLEETDVAFDEDTRTWPQPELSYFIRGPENR